MGILIVYVIMLTRKEGLDRGVCNQEWQCLFPKVGVRHLLASTSDHGPILPDTYMESTPKVWPFFRFEAMWTRDTANMEVVKQAWQVDVEGSHCFKLARKIQQADGPGWSWWMGNFQWSLHINLFNKTYHPRKKKYDCFVELMNV